MLTIKRTSTATWTGDVENGFGTVVIGRDLEAPFSLKTRMGDQPATNPEELLGAALAGCYAMSLSNELGNVGTPSDTVDVKATVHLVQGADGFGIPRVDLLVTGTVPGLTSEDFERIAAVAHANCPVAKLYDAEITLQASLGQA